MPQTKYGSTPLMAACRENELEVARVLINKRAAVNYQSSRKVCNYLHCFNNLSYSRNKLFVSQSGWTALHVASSKGHANLVNLLIDSGAQCEIKNKVSVKQY